MLSPCRKPSRARVSTPKDLCTSPDWRAQPDTSDSCFRLKGETLSELRWFTLQLTMAEPRHFLGHGGTDLGAPLARDGALPDPESTNNPELNCVLPLDKFSLSLDATRCDGNFHPQCVSPLRHHHCGPHEEGEEPSDRWKHRTLRQRDRLGWLGGLGRYDSRQHQASEDRLPRGQSVRSCWLQAYKNDAYLLPTKLDEKVAKTPSRTRYGAHCPYSGTSSFHRCQVSRPFQGWTLPLLSDKFSRERCLWQRVWLPWTAR